MFGWLWRLLNSNVPDADLKDEATSKSKFKHEWPFCDPPPESHCGGGPNIDGIQYKKKETSPDVWQYVVDEEAMEILRHFESQREDLWWALRSRVLTDEELIRARNYGTSLNVVPMQAFNPLEKSIELNNAFARQAELRIIAARDEPSLKPA